MSKDEKKETNAPNFDELFGGNDDVTGEQLLDRQHTADKDLMLKTDIKDPMAIVGMKFLASAAEHYGYTDIQELLDGAVDCYLQAMVSHKRQGRKEFRDAWVALMEANFRKKQGLADELFGGSR